LIGPDLGRLRAELESISSGRFKQGSVPPLWDGKAAERIVAHIEAYLS
jgi:UDP-N-acetylglucosamine 2-epimerase (non-hydrolysing)